LAKNNIWHEITQSMTFQGHVETTKFQASNFQIFSFNDADDVEARNERQQASILTIKFKLGYI
jgi:curli biogenesis system outer membrane secretion channel CsgG